MWQNCFMPSIDLSDAYYSVPETLTDQKYLLFKFEGQMLRSTWDRYFQKKIF